MPICAARRRAAVSGVPPNHLIGQDFVASIYGTRLTVSPPESLLSELVNTGACSAAAGMSNTGTDGLSRLQYLVAGTVKLENVFVPVMQPPARIAIIPASIRPERV